MKKYEQLSITLIHTQNDVITNSTDGNLFKDLFEEAWVKY